MHYIVLPTHVGIEKKEEQRQYIIKVLPTHVGIETLVDLKGNNDVLFYLHM